MLFVLFLSFSQCYCMFRERESLSAFPFQFLCDALYVRIELFLPIQPRVFPLRQIPFDVIIRGIALCPQTLDERFSLLNVGEADKASAQFQAALPAMNTAVSLGGTVDRITPVALVE